MDTFGCPDCGRSNPINRTPRMCRACGWSGERPGYDIARSSDPETSKAAAERVTRSGARQSQKAIVLADVQAHPGTIYGEIAERTPLTEHQVGRRLSELVRDGSVVRGAARDGQQTNWPVEAEPDDATGQVSLL